MASLGVLERLYVQKMKAALSQDARAVIEQAMRSKDTAIDTGNQMDAYGFAIWYKGKLILKETGDPEHGKYAEEPHKGRGDIPDGYGSDWADMFIKEFPKSYPLPQDRFVLVVFNAAFYSKIQEHGGGGLKREYRIISQVVGELDNVGKKYGGTSAQTFGL